jgi:hypothetical protein
MPFLRLGVDSMGKKKFALLGVCVMLCLLIMSAMSGSLLGYSNAWFTSSAQADASITADFILLEDIIVGGEEALNGFIACQYGKCSTEIGVITSKVDGLTVSCVYEDPDDKGQNDPETGNSIYSIIELKPKNESFITPVSPINFNNSDSETFYVNTHITGNTASGIYKGQLIFSFAVDDKDLVWIVPLQLVIP